MKPKYNRLSRLNQIVLAVATTGALISSAHASTYYWTNNDGNWSDSSMWSAGVPSNDGTADVVMQSPGGTWSTVNPTALTPSTTNWSINSLTSDTSDDGIMFCAPVGSNLSIGAGGIFINNGNQVFYDLPIIATASQSWNVASNYPLTFGDWPYGANPTGSTSAITLNNGVNVTKTGNGTIYFNNGTTTTVGTGHFTFDGGTIQLDGTSQFGRLGTNQLGVTANPSSQRPLLDFVDSASGTFPGGLSVVGGLVGSNLTIGWGNGPTVSGTTLTVTGALSGGINGGAINDVGFIIPQIWSTQTIDDRNQIIFQGDGSGLTALNPTNWGLSPLHVVSGVVVLDNANAMGTGNNLISFVGNTFNQATNYYCGLVATSGHNVSGGIYLTPVQNSSNQHNAVVELGLKGTGSVTFSGEIRMQNWGSGSYSQMQRLKLTAPAGGTATFSGKISDASTYGGDTSYVPVKILAGGTVELSGNNTYKGTTAVRGGTLLLAGYNNALGAATSNVSLGDVVTAPSGGDVKVATTSDSVLSDGQWWTWGFSGGVLNFTTAVTTVDGVSLSAGDRILYKDAQNAERTGVYTYTDSTHWTRSTDLNTAAAFTSGLRVHVTNGTLNGGKNYYLYEGLVTSQYPSPVLGHTAGDGSSAMFFFNEDVPSTSDVALLTNDALTISRNIDVTNNLSTGKSILGGNSAVASTFSGTVALSKNLTVTAASSGTATFSGAINGSNTVTKEGLGTVKFSTAKAYTGTTSVTAGTLEVDNTLASSAVSVGSGGTLQGTGTLSGTLSVTGTGVVSPGLAAGDTLHAGATTISGHLAVQVDDLANSELMSSGAVNLSGGTVDVTVGGGGFTQPYYVIAQGSSITGTLPSVTTGYVLTKVGNQLQLSQPPTNTYSNWMSTNYPSITGTDALPTANPSHDGISNLVKYALDLNPTVSAQPAGTHTGSSLTFTKGTMAKADSNLTYSIEESTDLATWGAPTLGSVSYGDTITYTYPSGQSKVFARLKVVQTP